MLKNILYVGIGGFFGSSLRYVISKYLNSNFPYGTLLVNTLGSLLLGFLAYKFIKSTNLPPEMILLLTTGFIGAFTTFSTFMFESQLLFSNQQLSLGLLNIFLNLALGLSFVYIGMQLGKIL